MPDYPCRHLILYADLILALAYLSYASPSYIY
jgi:hypothetical protein